MNRKVREKLNARGACFTTACDSTDEHAEPEPPKPCGCTECKAKKPCNCSH